MGYENAPCIRALPLLHQRILVYNFLKIDFNEIHYVEDNIIKAIVFMLKMKRF